MHAADPAGRRRRALSLAAAALLALLAVPQARALDTLTPADASVAELRAAVTSDADEGSQAATDRDKREAYRRARELLKELQRIAAQPDMIRADRAPADAQAAIAALEQGGFGTQPLAALDFRWSLAVFAATAAASADEAGDLVALDAIVRDLTDPGERINAYAELARAQQARDADGRMRRYATLATEELAQLDPPDRSRAAQPILRLVIDIGPDRLPGAAAEVIGLLPTAAERGRAAAQISRAALPEAQRSLGAAGLAETADALRTEGSIDDAAAAALAIPLAEAERRQAQLEQVLTGALEARNLRLATRIALGIADADHQSFALRRVIATAIGNGIPLQAIDTPPLIPVARARALGFLDLAADLADRGYDLLARRALDGAAEAAAAADDAGISAVVAAAAARMGNLALAEQLVGPLPDGLGANRVRTAIAVRLAGDGKIAEAEAQLARIAATPQRAITLQALGSADLRGNDRAAAFARADAIGDDARAAGLLAAIAANAAENGDRTAYDAALVRLPEGPDKIAAAAAMIGRDGAAPDLVAGLLRQVGELDISRHAPLLATIAGRLVAIGARADALAIADPAGPFAATRDAVLEAIARADLARGAPQHAFEAAAAMADRGRANAITADAAIAEAAAGRLAEAAERVRGLPDYRDRVRAFRSIAENRSRELDRYGLFSRGAEDPADASAAANVVRPVEVDRTDAVRVVRLDGIRLDDTAPRLPDTDVHTADIRASIPPLEAGITDLSLARLNRFNAKFFEDIVGTSARDFLFNAQTNINPTYVFLSRGTFTLGQVAAQLGGGEGWEIGRDGTIITLRVPLVVGPFATLILSGAEASEYRISASKGAFIVNAGKLYVVDTSLIAYDEDLGEPAYSDYENKSQFRPFVTAWSDSQTYIAGSRFVGFGYSAGKTYGLSFTAGPRDIVALRDDSQPPAGIVVDSSFEQMLYGFYSYEAEGVSVIGNEYRDNIVYGIDPHDRSKDLRFAFNTAYGTAQKHGIIISREVDHSYIVGNLSFDNQGSGIMLDRNSVGNVIYANDAFANRQDGISLFESSCNLVVANRVERNERSGIRVRNSANVGIAHNQIRDNAGAGLEAYIVDLKTAPGSATRDFVMDPFEARTTITAAWNVLEANGSGIALRGASEALLHDNAFLRQSPKLYGGDLQPLRVRMLGFTADTAVLVTGLCTADGCDGRETPWLQRTATYSPGPSASACPASPAPEQAGPTAPAAEASDD